VEISRFFTRCSFPQNISKTCANILVLDLRFLWFWLGRKLKVSGIQNRLTCTAEKRAKKSETYHFIFFEEFSQILKQKNRCWNGHFACLLLLDIFPCCTFCRSCSFLFLCVSLEKTINYTNVLIVEIPRLISFLWMVYFYSNWSIKTFTLLITLHYFTLHYI
jgi:hypothetical protein